MTKFDAIARDLAEALYELDQRDLWRAEGDEVPPFVIDLEGEGHPILAMFAGEGDGERGLMLVRGEGALEEFEELVEREDADFDQLERASVLQAHVWELADVPPPLRALSQAAGIRAQRKTRVPVAVSKPPGGEMRSATREEVEVLLHCVQGILFADEQGEFSPEQIEAQGEATLELTIRKSVDEPCGGHEHAGEASTEPGELDLGHVEDEPPAGASERS